MDPFDQPLRVLIAHAQKSIRRRLRTCLETTGMVRVAAEASNGRSARLLVARETFDLLLVDPALPLISEMQTEIARGSRNGGPKVIAVVPAITRQHVVKALRIGASGITLDTAPEQQLLAGVRAVTSDRYFFPDEAITTVVDVLRESVRSGGHEAHAGRVGLTPREIEIVQRIAAGLSNRRVGEEFSISERTVKQHLTNIFAKIGVSNRTALALFAVSHHLVPAGPAAAAGASRHDS